jgi:proline iminopeptidase
MNRLSYRIDSLIVLAAALTALIACGGQEAPAGEQAATAYVEQAATAYVAPVQELDVMSEDLSLYVRQVGGPAPAEVLIAINGGPGQSSHYMAGLEQLAGPQRAVVTYDQRGTLRSDSPPPSSDNFELVDYTADLEAIREMIGAEEVDLLGHSWGALIAMAYATTYPEHTRSLIFMGGAASDWAATQAGMASFQQRLVELQRSGVISSTLPREQAEQFEAMFPAYLSDPTSVPKTWQPPAFDATTNRLTWSNIQGYDLTDALGDLKMPVLLLWGEDDPFGREMAEATRDALTGTEVEYLLLKECGHYWHECPGQFYPAVREFLSR